MSLRGHFPSIEPVLQLSSVPKSRPHSVDGGGSLNMRAWRCLSDNRRYALYLGFFQFVHNARRRGKALLGELVAALVA